MSLPNFTKIFILLYFFPATSAAITYYVSPFGNNNNSGTSINQPWQTISKINGVNFKGDTILFQGGSTFPGNFSFNASDVGTPLKPIVIGSYGSGRALINSGTGTGMYVYNSAGFKIQNLIFSGSGVSTNTGGGIVFYMDKGNTILPYLNLNNVEVYGFHEAGISFGTSQNSGGFSDISVINNSVHDNGIAGIAVYGDNAYVHKNVYIGYTKVYNNSGIANQATGNSGSGIVLGNIDGAVVEYCTAYNNGWLHSNQDGGPVGIWAYKCNNAVIQYNQSHHNKTGGSKDGGGFDLDGGCTNSTMQYNYSHDNDGAGFLLAEYEGAPLMKNIIVRYNISENDGRKNSYSGIYLWSSSAGTLGMQSVDIYNNTVYVSPAGSGSPSAFLVKNGVFSGVNVRNNIFQIKANAQMCSIVSTSGLIFQGNNYWTSGSLFKIRWGSANYSSLSSWRTATGQEKINGVASGFQVDPQFADTTTGVTFTDATQLLTLKSYKLKPTSALIIQGLNLSAMFGTAVGVKDFWGNNILNKTMYNIGCDQLNTTKTLSALADAYVRNGNYSSVNYGSDTSLAVKSTSGATGYSRNTYLKFGLSGVIDVVSARLRLYGRNIENTSGITVSAFSVTNDTWTESGIKWISAPAQATFLSSAGVNGQLRYYEFDVTSFVKTQFAGDRVVSFIIRDTTNQNKNIAFSSKENRNNFPQLIIATTALISTKKVSAPVNQIADIESDSFEKVFNPEISESPSLSVRVYPNPLQKKFILTCKTKYKDAYYFQFQDEAGKIIKLEKHFVPEGQSKISFDISGLYLKPGLYILNIYSDTRKAETIKLVVQ